MALYLQMPALMENDLDLAGGLEGVEGVGYSTITRDIQEDTHQHTKEMFTSYPEDIGEILLKSLSTRSS